MLGVHKLWILERQAGICLFEQTFEGSTRDVDSDLIGGFLTAISKFCEELVGEEISSIRTPTMRILYHAEEKFVIAVLLPKDANHKIARTNVSEISRLFAEKYAPYLDADQLANVAVFNDFAAEIETRFDTKAKCYIHYLREKRAKRREKFENLFDQIKTMMEERHNMSRRVACRQDRQDE